ncbi:RNA-binding protein involved in heterochromatin assembly dri1 isoform X1 [Syzygium oleosum]|uniref:RNA-binding protein involved in heterochromatin assembly dri1 isoform X1 n=1 Tax=Syzygium oleosum TaxID=219896 RepID=UPI0024BB3BE7|nr:RNA-binding protein involved in heterochromatin assembly dri1 isoform X1 [Syzygium oleosum]
MGEGREGDWECSGCNNRNYAFRSFCNRCKQPRLLVDTKTPADSKWLPRIGDWICTGCTNNNYASREKCKKCGQPKEVAAMPAVAMPGASLPTYSNYFARSRGGLEQNMNLGLGLMGSDAFKQSLPLNSSWSFGEAGNYEIQASVWSLGANSNNPGHPFANPISQYPSVPKGWRNGDWICHCGFHNYSSRSQCKKCNASMTPALGMKRLASDDLVHGWDNKRLNAGTQTTGLQQSYPAFDQMLGTGSEPRTGAYSSFGSSVAASNIQVQIPHQAATPALLGKGAKQWRQGDWMCTNCNNHNYASRAECNRCKTQRTVLSQPVNVV